MALIEQWGSGIQRITAACREAGLGQPVFEEIAMRFRVTIPAEHVSPLLIDAVDQAILDFLAGGEGRTTSEMAKAVNLTSRAVRTRLDRLVGRGLVLEVGTGLHDPKRRYYPAIQAGADESGEARRR